VKNIPPIVLLLLSCFYFPQPASACEPSPAGLPALDAYIGHPSNHRIQAQSLSFTLFDVASFQISAKFAGDDGCIVAAKISELDEGDHFPIVAKIGNWLVGQSYGCDHDGCYDVGMIAYNTVSGEIGGCLMDGKQAYDGDSPFKIPGENLVIFGSKDGGYMINLNLGNTSQLPGYVYGCGSPTQDAQQILTRWQFFDQIMALSNRLGK